MSVIEWLAVVVGLWFALLGLARALGWSLGFLLRLWNWRQQGPFVLIILALLGAASTSHSAGYSGPYADEVIGAPKRPVMDAADKLLLGATIGAHGWDVYTTVRANDIPGGAHESNPLMAHFGGPGAPAGLVLGKIIFLTVGELGIRKVHTLGKTGRVASKFLRGLMLAVPVYATIHNTRVRERGMR